MTLPLAYLQFPDWVSPVLIPGLPFRWYGLMYLFAFGTAYLLVRYQVRREEPALSVDTVADLFFWIILGLLLGGRLVSTLIYDTSGIYWTKPWLIFWPFDESMRFVGLQGMSYHGGLVGGFIGGVLFCRRRGLSPWLWADRLALAVPLGYTFGRLGNFINAELYGRVSGAPWAMVFPGAEKFPLSVNWVAVMARDLGLSSEGSVNLPRHPSQLYEAFGEGVLLWLLLWFVVRKRKSFNGFIMGWYLIGYGAVRFVIEYFRQPDSNLGFILELGPAHSIYQTGSFLNFTLGQVLCTLMILGGIIILALTNRRAR
ncbi:prolipoprotein diacylglyceryl transferase [Marispirochaeta sp.]|jgi:phosphatidylglycerol---prolipoprotein diacylglyceryl transferase|uniref:prolipoprotein diacylglyceryl transferase n=1 Tax=Marispirochaeta sp. TaxID=2038653 RepID=UPI0029C7526E|nr:prolipoprotein diacylglyceryl transferase [Marispirochaeta sp.]